MWQSAPGLRHKRKRRRRQGDTGLMSVQALKCKECDERYPLDARFVCERCFGPLEVEYDLSGLDADETRRKIQAGPPSIWRYADFLPFERPPRTALSAGITPLVRADRLAERLGLREVWVKNDAANPTHSFKDRVVTVALAKARELGYEVVACASTGNLANAVAAHAAAAGCCPVADAFEAGRDVCRPVRFPDTIAKSLAIGDPADGPYALDLARRSGGGIDSVSDEEIRDGIRLLTETAGVFTETAGGVTTAVLRKLAERGEIDSDERVVLTITGEGLKTLDAVRGTFETHEIEPTVDSFESAFDGAAAVTADA